MKMKEKTKLKTTEEIPLEELESQIQVESEYYLLSAYDTWNAIS